jgi:6-phosphofructokinase 1
MLSGAFGWRGEFQVTESLQMSAGDRAVKLDYDEAYGAGREAVRLASRGTSGVMVTIERKKGAKYASAFGTIPLKKVAINARPMDDKYIDDKNLFVTKAFYTYAAPLVGELPKYAALKIRKAKAMAK